MAGSILLPTPFAANSVTLGQLLCDPLDPSRSFRSASTSHVSREPVLRPNHKETITLDNHGRFVSTLSRLPPSPLASLLAVDADHAEYHSLDGHSSSFHSLRQDASTARFLRQMALQKQPLYYVVGLQKLRNPTFKRAAVDDGRITSAAHFDPNIRLPIHLRRDSATDLDETSNDVITGMEVRKVKCLLGRAEEPHSIDDIDYSWSYENLEDDLQLSIGLGKALEQAELHALAGIITDEDYTDLSYDGYYDYSDDEGHGGF